MAEPDFSIVTPSFQSMPWLPLCARSIGDQEGVVVEHIVQDARSSDGTVAWLEANPRIKARVEPDGGMYDAINRGMARATGRLVAYLNSDEQYLPSTLRRVTEFFDRHPDTDILFCSAVVVDSEGRPLAIRGATMPSELYVRTCMFPLLTCSMFLRRSVLDRVKPLFDTRYRVVGDAEFFLRAKTLGLKMATQQWPASVFLDNGANLGLSSGKEMPLLSRDLPRIMVKLSPVWRRLFQFRRLCLGLYRPRRVSVRIYTQQTPLERSAREAVVSERWVGR
jgi:glycosyltransferase involved in cell wall biosynthesis